MRMRMQLARPVLAMALAASLVIQGCGFGSVMNGIAKWLPVGEQAFSEIIAILAAAGVVGVNVQNQATGAVAVVNRDFADIQNAIAQYNAAPSTYKATTLQKVVTAMNVLETDLNTFLADARVLDQKDQNVITLAVGALTTTLAALEAQISPSPSISTKAVNAPRTPAAFKVAFNTIMVQNGYPQYQVH